MSRNYSTRKSKRKRKKKAEDIICIVSVFYLARLNLGLNFIKVGLIGAHTVQAQLRGKSVSVESQICPHHPHPKPSLNPFKFQLSSSSVIVPVTKASISADCLEPWKDPPPFLSKSDHCHVSFEIVHQPPPSLNHPRRPPPSPPAAVRLPSLPLVRHAGGSCGRATTP